MIVACMISLFVRMFAYVVVVFVVVFSMFRLYGEKRSILRREYLLHQLQRQVTHYQLPIIFLYALVDF